MEFPDGTGMYHHPLPYKNDKQAAPSLLQPAVALSSVSFPVKPGEGKGFSLPVNSNMGKRKKKKHLQRGFTHSSVIQPQPKQVPQLFFHDTSTWIFPRADVRAFHGERAAFSGQAGKEGFPSRATLNVPFVLLRRSGQDPARTLSPRRNSPRGGHRDILTASAVPPLLTDFQGSEGAAAFPSAGPEVVTQGHLLFHIPARGWKQQTNEKWGGGTGGNINKPSCLCFLNAAFRFNPKARFG